MQDGGAVVHAVVVGRQGQDKTVEVGGGDAEGEAVFGVGCFVAGGQAHQARGDVAVQVEVEGRGERGARRGVGA